MTFFSDKETIVAISFSRYGYTARASEMVFERTELNNCSAAYALHHIINTMNLCLVTRDLLHGLHIKQHRGIGMTRNLLVEFTDGFYDDDSWGKALKLLSI